MRSSRLVPWVLGLVFLAVPAHAVKPGSNPTDLSTTTQNWDNKLPNDARFTVLADFNGQAARDNETGLVWEQAPAGGRHGPLRESSASIRPWEAGRAGDCLLFMNSPALLMQPKLHLPFL